MNSSPSARPDEPKIPARRPIRSRNTWWAERITRWLISIHASPNAISIAGMLAAIAAGTLLASTQVLDGPVERISWLAAGALCQFRLLCNLFDGMVAIDSGKASPVGELYNEVPDRVSDVAVFVGLGYSSLATAWIGWLAAVLVMFVPYVRMTAVSAGAPNDFCGPMAKPQRMAIVTALCSLLTVLPETWRTLPSQPEWSLVNMVLLIVAAGSLLTSVRRLVRAARSLRSRPL